MGKSGASSKADTAVKLVLVFFISLLSFSVGTYVGKQVSDSDARRAALELEHGGVHSDEMVSQADPATAPISNEDVTSLTEEFLKKERKVASEEMLTAEMKAKIDAEYENQHIGSAQTEDGYTHRSKMKAQDAETVIAAHHGAKPTNMESSKPGAPSHKAEATRPSAAAERVADDKAPTPDPKKNREPSSVLPSVASTAIGKYTVQVASYATEAEAKDQAAKLSSRGYSAFYVPAQVNNKTWYRVSVGLFSDQKSASNYRTELLATQVVTSAIVQKIVK